MSNALSARDAILRTLLNDLRYNTLNVIDKYNLILENLGEKPSNESEFNELRRCIDRSMGATTELMAQMDVLLSRMDRLEIFHSFDVNVDNANAELLWSLRGYRPQRPSWLRQGQ